MAAEGALPSPSQLRPLLAYTEDREERIALEAALRAHLEALGASYAVLWNGRTWEVEAGAGGLRVRSEASRAWRALLYVVLALEEVRDEPEARVDTEAGREVPHPEAPDGDDAPGVGLVDGAGSEAAAEGTRL